MNDVPPPDPEPPLQSKAPAMKSATPRQWPLPEVRIVTIYFISASLWIILTDLLLTGTRVGGVEASIVQLIKGLNFVGTTALLLYLVLRRAYGGWRLAEQRRLAVIERASGKFRQLSQRIQTLQEEERTRIAREIHDELGQLLTGIKLELRLVENRLSDFDDRALNGLIDRMVDISEMVDETIGAVQRISSGLRPSMLDHLGLGCALAEEVAAFARRSGLACTTDFGGLPDTLPAPVVTAAFRIVQEALTNTARHSGAARVTVAAAVGDGGLRLVVRDDGVGIDAAAIDDPRSLGLIGMRERAESLGGGVTFLSDPEGGTEVRVMLPLEADGKPFDFSK